MSDPIKDTVVSNAEELAVIKTDIKWLKLGTAGTFFTGAFGWTFQLTGDPITAAVVAIAACIIGPILGVAGLVR